MNTIEADRNERPLDKSELLRRARSIVRDRTRRSEFFTRGIFGEPAWDMLLHLYIADWSGHRHTVVTLIKAAGATMTTGLRWLDVLYAQKLAERREHPTDKRSSFVQLTPRARDALNSYLSGTA